MEELERIEMNKETLEISGERHLYSYTFDNAPQPSRHQAEKSENT
jgi:hypothetical protein